MAGSYISEPPANLMQSSNASYVDWKDYFKQKLTSAGLFRLTDHRGDGKIEVEIYTATSFDFKTRIEVGYTISQRLSYLRILNPFTPGLNQRQEKYFFDRNDFYPHFTQDGAGLEFDDYNLRGIDEYLSQGFQGSETVYLRNGKPEKSVLKSNTFPWTGDIVTFYFVKSIGEVNYEQIVNIDLNTIFSGINTANKRF